MPDAFVYTRSIHLPNICQFQLFGQADAKGHSDSKFGLCQPLVLVLPVPQRMTGQCFARHANYLLKIDEGECKLILHDQADPETWFNVI